MSTSPSFMAALAATYFPLVLLFLFYFIFSSSSILILILIFLCMFISSHPQLLGLVPSNFFGIQSYVSSLNNNSLRALRN